jgi:hypothetical protein
LVNFGKIVKIIGQVVGWVGGTILRMVKEIQGLLTATNTKSNIYKIFNSIQDLNQFETKSLSKK